MYFLLTYTVTSIHSLFGESYSLRIEEFENEKDCKLRENVLKTSSGKQISEVISQKFSNFKRHKCI